MKIYCVGNKLVKKDQVPILYVLRLCREFPDIMCVEADPNENFIPEDGSVIIDTVKGIDEVTWFDSLDAFEQTRSVSPHDYDLGFHLRLLQKLNKISRVCILGIPQHEADYFKEIVKKIKEKLLLRENTQP